MGNDLHEKGSFQDVSNATGIRFWIRADGAYKIRVRTSSTSEASSRYDFNASTAWQQVTVPMSNLGSPSSIDRILIQNATAEINRVVYVDQVEILQGGSNSGARLSQAPLTDELLQPFRVKIFPNPLDSKKRRLGLEVIGLMETSSLKLSLFDMLGREILKYETEAHPNRFVEKMDLPSGIPQGQYFLTIDIPQKERIIKRLQLH